MKRLLALALLALLAGCRVAPEGGPATDTAADRSAVWPPYPYRAQSAVHAVYALDADRSSLDFVVRREGALARFGHDHVLSPTDLEGWLLAAAATPAMRADVRFSTRELALDEPAARTRYALDTTPDEAAIAGTRDNLLREVLRRDAWPEVTVTLNGTQPAENGFSATLSVRWGEAEYRLQRPLNVAREDREIRLTGTFRVRQTELGMTPLAILGGGLRVRDEIEVYLDLRGTRLD